MMLTDCFTWSGTLGIDDGSCGGAGARHSGFDLVAKRIAGLELGKKVDALVVGGGENWQSKQNGGLNCDTKTAHESWRHVRQRRVETGFSRVTAGSEKSPVRRKEGEGESDA